MPSRRVRRSPDEAKRLILEAAEELLAGGGVAAVNVRAVAERAGLTDAGVNHHFGGRDGLLTALLRHGGRRIRAEVHTVTADWIAGGARVGPLVQAVGALYRRGYGQLAVALHAAGWRDDGTGMLEPAVEAIHQARIERSRRLGRDVPALLDTQLALAALHHALATEPVYGAAFRRSVGLTAAAAADPAAQLAWWTATLSRTLDLPE